jgi:hypothetical protein
MISLTVRQQFSKTYPSIQLKLVTVIKGTKHKEVVGNHPSPLDADDKNKWSFTFALSMGDAAQ